VVEADNPFIIPLTHQGDDRVHGIGDPLRTVTGAKRGELALVDPFVMPVRSHGGGGNEPRSPDLPLRTVTATKRGEFAVVEPFVVRHGHYSTKTGAGLREGCGAGTFRGQQLVNPLATVCATNDKHLVAPIITKHYGGVVGHDVERTLGTVTATDHHALTAAWLLKYHGGSPRCHSPGEPLRTLDTSNRFAEVRAFLTKFYSAGGKSGAQQNMELFDPLHTVTAKARFGLVMVHGEPYEIVDIGMRMLQPHELFGAQGFPGDYIIAPDFNGKPLTKTDQTTLAGNSVCPQVAEALIAANAREAPRMAA
jgi:DNA (cytosine-5)-methyltransferase 1